MSEPITPLQIRQNNRLLIYHTIYNQRTISQRDLCEQLRLSRPTVTACLTALEQDGLIHAGGALDSGQVGRKAVGYSIDAEYRQAIGVSIQKNSIHLLLTNLYGEVTAESEISLEYQRTPSVHQEIAEHILGFIEQNHVRKTRILGIGLAFPAIVASDGQSILYGPLLMNTGLQVSEITRFLNLPCTLLSSSNCDALFELSVNPSLSNAFYLSLSEHISGACISDRVLVSGKHGHSADLAHLKIRTGGRRCYCGQTGCLETLCNLDALLTDDESLEDFFRMLRGGSSGHADRWKQYLADLARAIHMLHLIYDTDFILGGKLGDFLIEQDLEILYDDIEHLMLYPEERDFLHLHRVPPNRTAAGAALPYIWSFLGQGDL